MWFGTKDFMTWVPTPLSGADVSPSAWGASGTFLNGDAYARTSFNSHKRYSFSWPDSSSRRAAQVIKSFYEGTFGRGKIHFVDPLTYDTNVLPARWADPSITCDFEGPSLVPGVDPARVSRSSFAANLLPSGAAQYDFGMYEQLTREEHGLFVPIPDGYSLYLTHFGDDDLLSASPPQVWVGSVVRGGQVVAPSPVRGIKPNAKPMNSTGAVRVSAPQGFIGAQIWIGGRQPGEMVTGSLTVHALHGILVPDVEVPAWEPMPYEGWFGGQGHSGTRFEMPPTYMNHTGVDGGQVSYSASLIESVI